MWLPVEKNPLIVFCIHSSLQGCVTSMLRFGGVRFHLMAYLAKLEPLIQKCNYKKQTGKNNNAASTSGKSGVAGKV